MTKIKLLSIGAGIIALIVLGFIAGFTGNEVFVKEASVSKTSVVVEEKMPTFEFITYRYRLHTIARDELQRPAFFFWKANTTMIFEFWGDVQVRMTADATQRATFASDLLVLKETDFIVEVVNAEQTYIDLKTNDVGILRYGNTMPIEKIFESVNNASAVLKKTAIEDGAVSNAYYSFVSQYARFKPEVKVLYEDD